MDMQVSPVDSIGQWKHLHVTGLDSADPDFETPARIDVLLGADYYGEHSLADGGGAHEAHFTPRGRALMGPGWTTTI